MATTPAYRHKIHRYRLCKLLEVDLKGLDRLIRRTRSPVRPRSNPRRPRSRSAGVAQHGPACPQSPSSQPGETKIPIAGSPQVRDIILQDHRYWAN
jgi:hypothetical protein